MTNLFLETLLYDVFKAQGAADAAGLAHRAAKDFDMDQRDAEIFQLARGGMTALAISQRKGLSVRHVERIIAEGHRLERLIA